jgi:hypothetical protein
MKRVLIALMVVLACLALASVALAEVKKAKHSIELSDPKGDVNKITTSKGSYPGLDVVKLNIASDGKQIKFIATLNEPPSDFASSVLDIYFDTDNNPKSGIKLMFFKEKTGFTYKGQLLSCIKFDNGMTACTGGTSKKAKVTERFGAMGLDRFKGKTENEKENVVSSLGFPNRKKAIRTPIKGKVVEGVLDYEDLKVKPGQTIRLLIREASTNRFKDSLFPEVLLTLK